MTDTSASKRILVIGASRGIGLEVAKRAHAAGYAVRALSRSAGPTGMPHPRLEWRAGDALDPRTVGDALNGADAVVLTLGVRISELARPVRLFSESTRLLVPLMEERGIKRLLAVTGFGTGASRDAIPSAQRLPFRLIFGRAYDDKDVQEQIITESRLDWTIVRPGVLTCGPARAAYEVLISPRDWRNGIVSRGQVAEFIVQQITDARHVRQAPVLVCSVRQHAVEWIKRGPQRLFRLPR